MITLSHHFIGLRLTAILLCLLYSLCRAGESRLISTPDEFNAALSQLQAGITLRLNSGEYGSGHFIKSARGTDKEPIVIEAANPATPPTFTGGNTALHLQGCAHFVLRHLRVQNQKSNGLNIDDGGGTAHHITLEDIHVADTGPTGNTDAIKLSGLTDFVVRRCHVSGWGGQAVDMVGCRRGLLRDCRFEGKQGFSQATGPQAKGGSEDIIIRACTFIRAGERAVNLGGSTGRPYFRPADAKYEARRITVEGCLFIGGISPVAFAGVDAGIVRYNTFVDPEFWALRILQENREPGMIPCGNGIFENNIITVTTGSLRTWINIGPGTQPESFTFANNWWYHRTPAQPATPNFPASETGGTYGRDPQLDPAADYKPRVPEAQKMGHTAWRKQGPSGQN